MGTATMTRADLKALFDEVTSEKVGTLVDERIAAFKAEQARPNGGGGPADVRGAITPPGEAHKREAPNGTFVARCALVVAKGKHDGVANAAGYHEIAKRAYGADDPVTKAIGASVGSAGGFAVPEEFSTEIIELLRPASPVRSLNPVFMPLDTGTMSVPKLTTGSVAGYIGESKDAPKTEPVWGTLRLVAKKLAALVPISNDWIRRSIAAAEPAVRDDLVAAINQAGDDKFIRGDGSSFAPKGLRNWAPTANVITANATVNLANVTTDLGKLVLALEEANVRMLRPGWLMAPRTWNYLMTVRDTNGNFAFRPEMLGGTLYGWPFRRTTLIPKNLGAGSNESEVYLADFADVVIGESTSVILSASTDAAYDDSGTIRSAFSRDETVILALVEHDLGMRHDEAGAGLTAVIWI